MEIVQKEKVLKQYRSLEESLKLECEDLKNSKQASEKLKEITLLGINQLENEVNDEKRLAFDDRSLLDELRRNRDVLQKEINRAETNNKK